MAKKKDILINIKDFIGVAWVFVLNIINEAACTMGCGSAAATTVSLKLVRDGYKLNNTCLKFGI